MTPDDGPRTAGYYRAVVEYDGTRYHGFQVQAQEPTIQQALEEALTRVTQQVSRVVAAGRTDAGVHAQGQVIAFRVAWGHPLDELQRALNALLPVDIVVRELQVAAEDFHPRFSAVSREYRYTVLNQPRRSPLARHFAYHVPKPLNVDAMAQACACLVGEHDFATFGQPPQGDNTVRRLYRAEWRREGRFIHFDVEANAFLYRMVRSIVGTALQVGMGSWPPSGLEEAMAARDRSRAGPTVPPHGLCLVRVNY